MVPQSAVFAAHPMSHLPFDRPVDLVHLALQTQGDKALEAEVLRLFLRQSPQILTAIVTAPCPRDRAAAAHKLKGSANAIGARAVADHAASIEIAASTDTECREQFADLSAAIAVANRYITDILS
jgi:HPt (histidine-containing phosphotransfer) domain-containing protein